MCNKCNKMQSFMGRSKYYLVYSALSSSYTLFQNSHARALGTIINETVRTVNHELQWITPIDFGADYSAKWGVQIAGLSF